MPLPIPWANYDPGTSSGRPSLDAARRRVRLNKTRQYEYALAYSEGPVVPTDYRHVLREEL